MTVGLGVGRGGGWGAGGIGGGSWMVFAALAGAASLVCPVSPVCPCDFSGAICEPRLGSAAMTAARFSETSLVIVTNKVTLSALI